MGEKLHCFAGKITEDFVVKELPKEIAAKARHTAANLQQKITKGKGPAKKAKKKTISMSLLTYKLHALGDYAQTICEHGTKDSHNSQTV